MRLRCRQRLYVGTFINKYAEHLWWPRVSITSSEVHRGRNFNYVMKLDGRVEGPFQDTLYALDEQPPLTRQLQAFHLCELYPWQRSLMDILTHPDDRKIHLVFDEAGNIGKSVFVEDLEYKGLAFEIPPFTKIEVCWWGFGLRAQGWVGG